MTNLNSYTIGNHLYRVGDEYTIGPDTFKIEVIINVLDSVFFYCTKKNNEDFNMTVSRNTSVTSKTIPIFSMVFHHRLLETLQSSGN
jgi:hypothetical protein